MEKRQLGIRLTEKDRMEIEKAVENGDAMNVSEFVRTAIREKLSKIRIEAAA